MATLTATFGSVEKPGFTVKAEDIRLNGQTDVALTGSVGQDDNTFALALAPASDSASKQSVMIPQVTNESNLDVKNGSPNGDSALPGDIVDEVRYHLRYQPIFIRAVERLVKAYRYEQADHAATKADLRDAQGKLQSLRTRLFQVETELKRTKYELNSVKESLAMTMLQLQNALNDLEDTKADLERALKELQERRNELAQVREQLIQAQAELRDAEEKLQDAEEKLQKRTAELEQAQRDLTKARGDLQNVTDENVVLGSDNKRLKQELADSQKRESDLVAENRRRFVLIETLKQQLLDANNESDRLREENVELEREKDEALRETVKLTQENSELKARLAEMGRFIHYPDRTRGDFYIDEVMWGGKVIDDEEVINKLLDYANNNERFTVNNDLMKVDPWVGVPKTFTAVYAIKGRGPFRYISNQEGTEAQFPQPEESDEKAPENPQEEPTAGTTDPTQPSQPGNSQTEPSTGFTDPAEPSQPADEPSVPVQSSEAQADSGTVTTNAAAVTAGVTLAPTGTSNDAVGSLETSQPPSIAGPTQSVQESTNQRQPNQVGQLPSRQPTGSFAQRQPYRQQVPISRQAQIAGA